MLQRSAVNIRLAKYAISTCDAYMCDLAIFHCQWGLERLFIFILENFGGMSDDPRLSHTHDMAMLIDWVDAKTNFKVPTELKEMADDLTEWRIAARYGEDHVGSLSTAIDLIRFYEDLRNEIALKQE